MENALTILGMAAVTFLARYAMVALLSRELPRVLSRWLSYVPVAIFAALVVPALLMPSGRLGFGRELLAGLVGLLAALKTRQVLPVILAGMAAYWLLGLAGLRP